MRASTSPAPRRAALLLVALYLAIVAAQIAYLPATPFMSVFFDEYLYDAMAVELAAGRAPTMNQVRPPRYPPLYPAALAPVALAFREHRFLPARLLNVALYTSMLFAVYALARRLVRPAAALAAGVASVLGPGLVNPPLFFAENLFYPLFAFYVLAVVRLIEAPGLRRSVVAGTLAAACFWTKLMAVVPAGVIGLALGWLIEAPWRRRLACVAGHALVFAGLVVPWAAGLTSMSMTLHEARISAPTSVAKYAVTLVNHVLAPLMSLGPLLVGAALAFGLERCRRGRGREGRLVLLFFALIATTIVTGAGWIATVEPGQLRVEERYQVMVYPLIVVLAMAAIESPPRRWRLWFLGFAALFLFTPTYQLDPGRGTWWIHVNPSPLLLHLTAIDFGAAAVKMVFIAAWGGLAVAFAWLEASPWRRLVWGGALATGVGYLGLVGGPIHDLKRLDTRRSEADLAAINRLLDAHLEKTDRIVFAGAIFQSVPFGVSTLRGAPYWHQQTLASVDWFPGTFDRAHGVLTWTLEPVGRVLVLARDGVTRGGRRVAREPPWALYELDRARPRLHSLLVEVGKYRRGVPDQTYRIFLWTLPPGLERHLRIEPLAGPCPRVKYRLYAPFVESGWLELREPKESRIPPATDRALSLLEIQVEGGKVRMAMTEKAAATK